MGLDLPIVGHMYSRIFGLMQQVKLYDWGMLLVSLGSFQGSRSLVGTHHM